MDLNEDLGKSNLQKTVDKETEEVAKAIEKKTFKKTKSARKKLEAAANLQKNTTNRMRMTNENLEEAKKSSLKTYKNSKEARKQATTLTNEQNVLNPFAKLKTNFETWNEDDANADADIEKFENRKDFDYDDPNNQKNHASMFGIVGINEEEETNQELVKILSLVEGIEKETKIQKNESKKQKTNLEEIQAASEYAKREAEFATGKLENFNDAKEK